MSASSRVSTGWCAASHALTRDWWIGCWPALKKDTLCRSCLDRQIVIYLVDANVFSEATRPDPAPQALTWLRDNERQLAVDPIILGEVRGGIYLLPAGKRRRRLERWFNQGVAALNCLPWDAATGLCWAELLACAARARSCRSRTACSPPPHSCTVSRWPPAIKNQKDFKKAGIKTLDPFV